MKEIIEYLLAAPDSQLHAEIKPYVQKWSDPPTALQVLEVLDMVIHMGLGSGFVVKVLQATYDMRCKDERTTHEEVVKGATWRK